MQARCCLLMLMDLNPSLFLVSESSLSLPVLSYSSCRRKEKLRLGSQKYFNEIVTYLRDDVMESSQGPRASLTHSNLPVLILSRKHLAPVRDITLAFSGDTHKRFTGSPILRLGSKFCAEMNAAVELGGKHQAVSTPGSVPQTHLVATKLYVTPPCEIYFIVELFREKFNSRYLLL